MLVKKTKKIRVRFAPSPTGFLHVGGLRTALYGYLYARQNKGVFFLRVEDTDQSRYVQGAVENLLHSVANMGLDWDEGLYLKCQNPNAKCQIIEKGDFGPYFQSKRLDIYKKYAEELIKNKHAYYCFCSAERLEKLRQTQELNKQPTMYDGFCRNLSSAEIKKKLAIGEPHVVRLAMPKTGTTKLNDLVRGEVEFENRLIDDQVLIKSDGFPTYHLAHVVDDHLMETNPVIRGEEWLSSIPKHLQLFKAFGWIAPDYAHIPLLLNPDKSKLSKRQGDVAVEDYLKKGYLPEALLNFVALLGWNPGTEREIFSLKELIKEFSLAKVQKSGAVFNVEKLDWLNSEYIKKMPIKKLIELCVPYLLEASVINEKEAENKDLRLKIEKIVKLEQERMKKLSDLPEPVGFFFKSPNYSGEMLVWRKSDKITTVERLKKLSLFYDTWKGEWSREAIEEKTLLLIKKENLDNGTTLWPMRVALSGLEKSPGPFDLADILGQEETMARIELALKKIK